MVEEKDPYRPWTGFQGMFNQLMPGLMTPDYLEREVFCGGPGPCMRAVRDALSGLGFPIDRYHQESFGPPPPEAETVPDDVHPQDDLSAEVTFAASGVTRPCAQTDTVLATARAAGLNIASGCSMDLRHLPRAEAVGNGAPDPQRRDHRRRHRRRLHPCLLFAPLGAVAVDA